MITSARMVKDSLNRQYNTLSICTTQLSLSVSVGSDMWNKTARNLPPKFFIQTTQGQAAHSSFLLFFFLFEGMVTHPQTLDADSDTRMP